MCSFLFQSFSTVVTEKGGFDVDHDQQFLSLSQNSPPTVSFYQDPGKLFLVLTGRF